jgi:GxxExxY protein
MPRIKNNELIYPKLSYLLNGLLFKIHNKLGRFRSEKEYGDALEQILKENGISYQREVALPPSFEGEKSKRNIPDFIINNKIILEIKAKRIITKEDYFQMRRYLAAYQKKLGIIVNFRQKSIVPKRVLNTEI